MNKAEWNQPADSLRDYDAEESDVTEIAASSPLPLLDQLVQKVELREVLPEEEAIISKVVEVAENNRTIERVLERKHEVKDFAAAKSQQTQFATRLSDLLDTKSQMYNTPVPGQLTDTNKSKSQSMLHLINSNSLYGYAIRYGFLSALLALTIATILVIILT